MKINGNLFILILILSIYLLRKRAVHLFSLGYQSNIFLSRMLWHHNLQYK